MVFIALVAVLLLLAILAREGRKSLSSLAIVLGVSRSSCLCGLRHPLPGHRLKANCPS